MSIYCTLRFVHISHDFSSFPQYLSYFVNIIYLCLSPHCKFFLQKELLFIWCSVITSHPAIMWLFLGTQKQMSPWIVHLDERNYFTHVHRMMGYLQANGRLKTKCIIENPLSMDDRQLRKGALCTPWHIQLTGWSPLWDNHYCFHNFGVLRISFSITN